jgi:hypothetical protein
VTVGCAPAPEPAAGGRAGPGGALEPEPSLGSVRGAAVAAETEPDADSGVETLAGAVPIGPGVGAFDHAAVAANSGERNADPVEEASAGSEAAGTVIRSLHEGHLAKARARDSVVVRNLPQCGQLNSIATLTLSIQVGCRAHGSGGDALRTCPPPRETVPKLGFESCGSRCL